MGEGEHLRRLAVGAIDEHQRRTVIGQREAAELLRVEMAVVVVEHDAADHHHDADVLGLLDEQPQRLGPGPAVAARVHVEAERLADPPSSLHGRHVAGQRADEGQGRRAIDQREVAIPRLPLLAGVDGIQQVRAGTRARPGPPWCGSPGSATARPAARAGRNSRSAHGWRGHSPVNCLSVGCTSPASQAASFGKPCRKREHVQPGTLTCPAQHVGTDGDCGS